MGCEGDRRHWEQVFADDESVFGDEPSEIGRRAAETFREHGCRKVLELGCGQGRDTWHLVKEGFEVHAIDYSETGICQMEETARCHGLDCKLTVHDALQPLPFPDGSFDALYSHMFFTMRFSMDELEMMMAECRRVLRPGGLHIYSVRNHDDEHYGRFTPRGPETWENPRGFVVRFFSREEVDHLASGWELLDVMQFRESEPPRRKTLYGVTMRKPEGE